MPQHLLSTVARGKGAKRHLWRRPPDHACLLLFARGGRKIILFKRFSNHKNEKEVIQHPVSETVTMSLTIMRRIKFCAGHRLYRHGGKCEFFHGHNYVADFYVTGDQVDDVGRVIDFADLKRLFKGWLDEHWDHGFVLNEADDNGMAAVKIVEPCKYYVLPYNPTAENMARYLLEEVCPRLLAGTGVTATKVVIWETEESFAEASLSAAELEPEIAANDPGQRRPMAQFR
jgi:6-pyruvoyltetrahydropterin/6-carboxytetrahydropterin synthase